MNLSGTGGTCVRPENEWDPTEDTELVENAFTALWNTVSSMQRSIGLDSLQNGPHIQLSGAQRYLYGLLAVYKLAVLHVEHQDFSAKDIHSMLQNRQIIPLVRFVQIVVQVKDDLGFSSQTFPFR